MQQPNFATPPHGSAALLEIGNNPPSDAIHPTQHPPHNPRCAPTPSSPSAGPRTPATPSSPPAHSRSRKRLADSVITGTSKRETRALTPPPLRRPPRHRGASLPLRTSDGRAVDRVHRARSLPTASVRAGARANSRALARRPAPRRSVSYSRRFCAPSERSRQGAKSKDHQARKERFFVISTPSAASG